MINVDEVTASRLISALMGVFFGKCCGNATLKKVGRSTMSVQNYCTASRRQCAPKRLAKWLPTLLGGARLLGRIRHDPSADDASVRLSKGRYGGYPNVDRSLMIRVE